jgi:hypothetical protein
VPPAEPGWSELDAALFSSTELEDAAVRRAREVDLTQLDAEFFGLTPVGMPTGVSPKSRPSSRPKGSDTADAAGASG